MSQAESQDASARVEQLRGALLTGRGPGASEKEIAEHTRDRPRLGAVPPPAERALVARQGNAAPRWPAPRLPCSPVRPWSGSSEPATGDGGRAGHRPPSARHPPERHLMTFAPSGRQFEISAGDQHATIVEVGGGIRSYRAGDRDVLQPYPAGQMCDGRARRPADSLA